MREVNKNRLPVPNPGGDSHLLFLTNIRSSQQDQVVRHKIAISKEKLRGKPFRTKTSRPFFCGKHKIAKLELSLGSPKQLTIGRIGCNSWSCPVCQVKKAIYARYLLQSVIELNFLEYFLTLTLDPTKIPPEYIQPDNRTHAYITKLFNHFLTVLKRKKFSYTKNDSRAEFKLDTSDSKIKYVWVIEFQKNGNAHLHILLNKFVPIEVVRDLWTHVGGGHIMRVEKVRNLEAIGKYITGYIAKGFEDGKQSGFKFFERRFSISRSCARPPGVVLPLLSVLRGEQPLVSEELARLVSVKLLLPLDEEKVCYPLLGNGLVGGTE